MIPNNPNQRERNQASVSNEDVAEGTTTIGITAGDSVVLATEQRASMGNLVASKTAKKIYQVTDDAALTISGGVGDGQNLAKTLKVEANLYEMRRGKPMTMTGLASMAGNVLRSYLFRVVPILGGVDDEGAHVFSLDPAGGVMEEEYVSTGSGSVIAYGVLEDGYTDDLSLDEAQKLAVRGLESAMERDTASGNGILLSTITPDEGFRQLDDEEVESIAQEL
ncbi:archaeal proteasome endopeptidase complex subunit beta [Haladaptatus sp. F3-133]|jgi:proteasome beta subunit|uniref:Proteasome subunit beta n=1 Tax=Halorutilus salinus TaxID=2487751 RepID=A0A9Q4C252_9EURY|nr:archaeal proteasome endopeptidase complex subunit beta [Halorutilus salinus]MCX2817918.1 archaeal proteasome endopeptidase complex subunit beta [Halorutilus salinus]